MKQRSFIILNYLLLLIAIVLSVLLYPIGVIYAIFTKTNGKYIGDMAESIDQLGNQVMQHAFNKWLISDKGYRFGNIDETVSSVLGKNKRDKTLNKTGRLLDSILNRLDPGHSIDSIEIDP